MRDLPYTYYRNLIFTLLALIVLTLSACRPDGLNREKVYLKDSLGALFRDDTPRNIKNTYSRPLSSDSFSQPAPKIRHETYNEGFYMIAASFYNAKKARAYQKRLQDHYAKTMILPTEQGYYRIAVAHFTVWRHATRYLQERYQNGDTSLWILHYRNVAN